MQVEVFLADLDELIVVGNQVAATELCAKNEDLIKENSLDVLATVTGHINEENQAEKPWRVEFAAALLSKITEMCSYDDVLLGLHKEIAETEDDIKFAHLLEPLQIALGKLPEKKFKYAIWCFNAMQVFATNMPAPESLDLPESERLLQTHDMDYDEQRILSVYSKIVTLYEAIAPKFQKEADNLVVRKYMLQLLGRPLCYLNLNPQYGGFPIAERIVKLVTSNCDPFKYLTWLNYKKTYEEDVKVDRLALANYFYLLMGLKISADQVPKVYNNIFVFQHVMYYLTELFTYDHQFMTEKGLLLAENVLIHVKSLPHELLDDDVHSKLTEILARVIIYSPMKENRQAALKLLQKYILGFDQRGRYLLIHNAFKLVNHSGLMGYLITMYKDLLVEELKHSRKVGTYFKGSKLGALIMQFCHLHQKEESDMLELADLIVPALNLLRFLVIRDREDATGFRGLLPEIEKVFMEPLKKGLMLSKAHYKLQIQNMQAESANGDNAMKSQVAVTISGQDLQNLSTMEKMNVLHASVTAFDVMESLLARLVECVENIETEM